MISADSCFRFAASAVFWLSAEAAHQPARIIAAAMRCGCRGYGRFHAQPMPLMVATIDENADFPSSPLLFPRPRTAMLPRLRSAAATFVSPRYGKGAQLSSRYLNAACRFHFAQCKRSDCRHRHFLATRCRAGPVMFYCMLPISCALVASEYYAADTRCCRARGD